jgi:hypothetical protein
MRPCEIRVEGEGEMCMISVLIVMTWLGNSSAGPMVSMQEFSNGERCEEARKALNEQAAF